ncbi:hypothetical protein KL930_002491 [Ogataea haglerorum]|nr:hypothetical protein KL915_002322 [Ogataea haglerorum]KAG7707729.1 hypothetical protein KL914_002550 [Ogataea haglerorum]KAG7709766.1 hypothetical protein KL950_001985 [Ogataea haglerorum]KAG7737714.1 hypothetical protein KL932_004017 [Ogataea haglerorum]KAG7778404.1 hypothetical protein KL930_002491 [Ogataea haglerorum]
MGEEFESTALSKKEQRKLKKLLRKAKKEEGGDDALNLEKLNESASDEEELELDQGSNNKDDEESDIPLSEAELEPDADVVPHTKLTVNKVAALKQSLASFALPWDKLPFDEHQSVTSSERVDTQVKDVYEDTERELAFYKQGLEAAKIARQKLLALNVPFTRPPDYFAEMVKSDAHMDQLKVKLIKEASEKKAREEARRQRQLKKFGKQVQNETLQKRQKEKSEALAKIKSLKRKKRNHEIDEEEFNIAVEEAVAAAPEQGRRGNKKQKVESKLNRKKPQRPGKSKRHRRGK